MIIAGTLVGAAGFAADRPDVQGHESFAGQGDLWLLRRRGQGPGGGGRSRTKPMREIAASECAIMMGYARKVIIIPGYGLAVAQAQHLVHELDELLEKRGVEVKYAIHPVAGRMPGHMNVLLAEADVPYPKLLDMEEINPEFEQADVALIIGANDVVNPAARTDAGQPDLRHAHSQRGQGQKYYCHQARPGHGIRRHRKRFVLQPQHPDAVRRRQKGAARIDDRGEGALSGGRTIRCRR